MKILLPLMFVCVCAASAQWVNMGLPRAGVVSTYARQTDTSAFAISQDRLYRQGADSMWRNVSDLYAETVHDLSVAGDTVLVKSYRALPSNEREEIFKWSIGGVDHWEEKSYPRILKSEYTIIPGTCSAVRFTNFHDYVVNVEVIDPVRGTSYNDTLNFDVDSGSVTVVPVRRGFVAVAFGSKRKSGGWVARKISDVTMVPENWQKESTKFARLPWLVPGYGIGWFDADTLHCHSTTDTMLVTIPDSLFGTAGPPVFFVDDGSFFCSIYEAEEFGVFQNGAWKRLIWPGTSSPLRILDSYGTLLYLGWLSEGLRTFDLNSGKTTPNSIGLSSEAYATLQQDDIRLYYNQYESRGRILCVSNWDEQGFDVTPNVYVVSESFSGAPVGFANRLWFVSSTFKSCNLDLSDFRSESIQSNRTMRVCFTDSTIYVAKELELWKHPLSDTHWVKMFDIDSANMFPDAIFVDGNNVWITSVDNDGLEDANLYVVGYTLHGTVVSPRTLISRESSISTQNFKVGKLNSTRFFISSSAGPMFWSDDPTTGWNRINPPTPRFRDARIFDKRVWDCDTSTGGVWSSADFVDWHFNILPDLPYGKMSSVVCSSNNCYANTDAGLMRLPRSLVSANDQLNDTASEMPPPHKQLIVANNSSVKVWANGELTVSDVAGNALLIENAVMLNEEVDLNALAPGIYVCNIIDGRLVSMRMLLINH